MRPDGLVELIPAHAEIGGRVLGPDEPRDKRGLPLPVGRRRKKGGHGNTSSRRRYAGDVGMGLGGLSLEDGADYLHRLGVRGQAFLISIDHGVVELLKGGAGN